MIVSPVMELIGLPGSMEFVWATAMLTNLYGVMIVNGFRSMWVIGECKNLLYIFLIIIVLLLVIGAKSILIRNGLICCSTMEMSG